ncbi:hypothetical protein ZEAMMB73_Zm00001d035187 [Zea mays]|uniref:Uncharacterized protein n=1 Tax=Zea mays TaxID=4577 RepID=A0A1D6LEX6_MAIZE|nr:hypothetical protein ZEAMMB73_Zm00001d035187 [Zea mays]
MPQREAAMDPPCVAPSACDVLQQQQRHPPLRRARQIGSNVVDLRSVCASLLKSAPSVDVAPRAMPMRRNASRWTAHATHRSGQVAVVSFTI